MPKIKKYLLNDVELIQHQTLITLCSSGDGKLFGQLDINQLSVQATQILLDAKPIAVVKGSSPDTYELLSPHWIIGVIQHHALCSKQRLFTYSHLYCASG
tara:strand:+ start:35735 stop:36034 length:300 start_codon:yes stop_codon:yes gene_type:complete